MGQRIETVTTYECDHCDQEVTADGTTTAGPPGGWVTITATNWPPTLLCSWDCAQAVVEARKAKVAARANG